MKKILNLLLTITLIGVLCLLGFLVAGVLIIQDKYEPENIRQTEIKVSKLDLEQK